MGEEVLLDPVVVTVPVEDFVVDPGPVPVPLLVVTPVPVAVPMPVPIVPVLLRVTVAVLRTVIVCALSVCCF